MIDSSQVRSDSSAQHSRNGAGNSYPFVSKCGAQQNEFLAALPHRELSVLTAHLDLVTLAFGAELFTMGHKLQYVYFPTTAIISLLCVTVDGATTEVAVIGREGLAGMCLFSGERATSNAIVQSAGHAFRLKAEVLREAFNNGGALPQLLLQYANALFAELTQTAVNSRHGTVEQRLCRWLLKRLDRSPSTEIKVTQELISLLLGVRRESITAAAHKLQDAGFIQNRRGIILIVNRGGLEHQAGECYDGPKLGGGGMAFPPLNRSDAGQLQRRGAVDCTAM